MERGHIRRKASQVSRVSRDKGKSPRAAVGMAGPPGERRTIAGGRLDGRIPVGASDWPSGGPIVQAFVGQGIGNGPFRPCYNRATETEKTGKK